MGIELLGGDRNKEVRELLVVYVVFMVLEKEGIELFGSWNKGHENRLVNLEFKILSIKRTD